MLRDKITLVTGASSGIGLACARSFAGQGARLILAARRRERLESLADELREEFGTCTLILELDVRDREGVNAAIEGLPQTWREIDILVNNAGLSRGLDKLQEGYHLDWDEMIDTNIKGLLWVSRAVMPGMVERDRGHLINIGSVAGHQVYTGGNNIMGVKLGQKQFRRHNRRFLLNRDVWRGNKRGLTRPAPSKNPDQSGQMAGSMPRISQDRD